MDWNPNQVLLDLHFIQIRYYSLMFVIAFSLGFYITKKIFLAENKPLEKLDTLVIYVAIATLLGARLGHVFFYDWDYFKVHPLEIILPFRFSPSFEVTGFAGLASHGAAVGIIIAMLLYIRKYPDMKLSWVLDRIVIAITIGGMFVRFGNFMNSEIVGKVVDKSFPFAVKFLQSGDFSAGEAMQLTGENTPQKAFEVIAHNPQFVEIYNQIPYRHPAQLYEAVGYFLLFWLLYYLYWKTNKKDQPYFIFGVFLIALWTIRFLVEYVKDSQGGIEDTLGVFSTGQWLSIPFILAGVFLLFFKRKSV
ncbi:Prolipoprotein diacylglyceryl transferase [Capnocytophaga granulosa]|jgi:prolipoprotein diacylglyceryl transferase|uniref:Phosphatidylglycerol--prolipoprotein diacylglyceryl transferase n=1 Tax=Capnocytophaga granulosa TaxID=45242 RepID=A0A1H2S2W7_9FLAO|nr:prolipoprotein diacylglyceryl transferase [Capnocytophaga granulosa]EPD30218.1 prolipoprotein diacylglyceryl transferase [Capnocytophaga granulosa ATCC 51502]SDW25938.1 Prolipoprotein diacylglyceryl transferase [Capnocytophaga granulosa]SUX20279.1 Prolipoprotein diacylglyceryl transferase [Capnocytophaga granulosa]